MPIETGSSVARAFRSRSRRGCLTCRQHRLKCDEKGPQCGNCSRLERNCRWGVKASFHPSRISQLSSFDSKVLSEIESGRQYDNSFAFIDETKEIEREYNGYDDTGLQHGAIRGNANESTLPEAESHFSEVTNERYTIGSGLQNVQVDAPSGLRVSQTASEITINDSRSSRNLRPIQYLHFQPPPIPIHPIYSSSNNVSLIHVLPQGLNHENPSISTLQQVLTWPINDHIKAGLLSLYFQDTSRWCEVTNSSKPFSTLWSHLVVESQAFTAAAVAFASITSQRRESASTLLTRELYAFARETLLHLKSENYDGVLLATTLLCMYCSALEKSTEEQSILHDCASLLQETAFSHAPDSVFTACFWAFARQDIWAAYSSGRPTLISADTWKAARDQALQAPIQDSYSNRAVCITARVINSLSVKSAHRDEITLQDLWVELQTWVIERPQCVRCIMEVEVAGDAPFPTILFSNPSAVCGNIYYHVASILLLGTGKICDDSSAIASPICHARRVAGISITNNEPANGVNNVPLIGVAARYVQNTVEKMAVLKHLKEIEAMTGWKTEKVVSELEALWGV